MSVWFGVVNFTDQPVEKNQLESIGRAAEYLTSGIQALLVQNRVAIGHVTRVAGLEGGSEALPATFSDLIITGKIRLDNRQELFAQLEVPQHCRTTMPNSTLVVEAYRKWGEDCTQKMIGDFAFAIWNKANQELFIGRDHFGTAEVYFFHDHKQFLFCSSLPCLLAHPFIPKAPNPLVMALSMLVVNKVDGSQTSYDRIRQLPSSHNLLVRNTQVLLKQYWSLDHIKKVEFQRDTDYLEAFLEHFSNAIACRIGASRAVGINLSGGLDSGSISVLAARLLQRQGQTLHAFTAIPLHDVSPGVPDTHFGDEGEYAKLTAVASGNTQLNLVNAEGKTPLSGITEALEILKHPFVAVSNCFWLLAIYERMQAQGLDTVLSGQFGNATISWRGNLFEYLKNLLYQGNLVQFFREFTLQRERLGWSYPLAIKNLILAPFVPPSWFERRLFQSAGPTPWEAITPLNSDFANAIDLRNIMRQSGAFNYSPQNRHFREFMLPVGKFSGSAVGAALAAPFGLELHDPTCDKRLIEFCVGIPESQYIRNDNRRLLIRNAMQGQLPDAVLMNKKRGLQSADLVMRIRNSHKEVSDELDLASRSPLTREYLDISRMKSVFNTALSDVDWHITLQTSRVLMRGLMASKFLRSFEA